MIPEAVIAIVSIVALAVFLFKASQIPDSPRIEADYEGIKRAIDKEYEEIERIRKRINEEICPYCGVDIFGKKGNTCPQCGADRPNKKIVKWPDFPIGRPQRMDV